jgi:uncharacterized delta-60 repeat protein
MLAFIGMAGASALAAQPPNDNFATPTFLGSATSGSISDNNTGATAETTNGEPAHAGFTANSSLWYTWTAPQSGDVEFDTIGSSVDTVLAVYTGSTLTSLTQIAANDDLFPTLPNPGAGQTAQQNEYGQNRSTTNVPPDNIPPFGIFDTNLPPGPITNTFRGGNFLFNQPFTGLPNNAPGSGASGLHFTAVQGVTYYIAVDSRELVQGVPRQGPIMLSWALRPSGVFRWASEDIDHSTGVPGMLVYEVSETETSERFSGTVNAGQLNSTLHTTYVYDAPGLLVTVTRVAGSSGRVTVNYSTVSGDQISDKYTFDSTNNVLVPTGTLIPLAGDAPAHAGIDYGAGGDTNQVMGTLTFDDFEMSKTILIPVLDDGGTAQPNRDFAVVLFSPAVGSGETADISLPRLDTNYSQSLVRILDADIDPRGPSAVPIVSTNMMTVTNIVGGTNVVSTTNVVGTNIFYSLTPTNPVFNFTKSHYRVPEDVTNYWGTTPITVYVSRSGTNTAAATISYRINNFFLTQNGADQSDHIFPLQPGSDYAIPNGGKTVGGILNPLNTAADFDAPVATGTLSFPSGNAAFNSQPITFTIFNTNAAAFNRDFQIDLYALDQQGNPYQVGMVAQASVTILFDDSNAPAGSVDEFYNPDFSLDLVPPQSVEPLNQPGTDPNGQVNSVAVLTNDESIIAGGFRTYDGNSRNGIAMVDTNGQLDTSFDPGDGISVVTGESISSVAVQTNGQIVAGGNFASFNGNAARNIVRLNADGSLDFAFLAASGTGANAAIRSVIVRSNGTILIAGDFTSYNGVTRNHVARLNFDGSLDTTFDPGIVLNGAVYAMAEATNGQLIVGGDFTAAGGIFGQDHIARLSTNGTIDLAFDPGAGTDARVRALIIMNNGQIVAGGDFIKVNGQAANHIVRLNTDGTVDTQFFSGTGTDAPVYHLNHAGPSFTTSGIVNVTNAETIYVGGSFKTYNGTRRVAFARLNSDGSLDTTFLDTAYNQFAGFPREHLSDIPSAVFASALESSGNVIVGGSFSQVGGGQFDSNVRPNSFDLNQWPEPKSRDGVRNRNNVTRLIGGSTPGPGNLSLIGNYSANKSQVFEFVQLARQNGTLGPASANFSIAQQTAQAGFDYSYFASPPLYGTCWEYIGPGRRHSDSLWGTNVILSNPFGGSVSQGINGPAGVVVNVLNPQSSSGNVAAQFQLANPAGADQFYLGGQNIPIGVALGQSLSPLTIIDDHKNAGTFGFSSPTYSGSSLTTITVIRTNGNNNTTPILINFATSAGSNAISGVDYLDTNGVLTFNSGDTNKTFAVQVIASNYISSVEKLVNLRLFNFPAGANPGLTNAVLRIINPNFQGFLNFSATNYVTNLSAGSIQFTVQRTVGSLGTLDVQYATTNGTAVAGVDYIGATNTLHWNSGDVSSRTVTIPLINNGNVGTNRTFGAYLFNPTLNGSSAPSILGTVTNTTLTINNDNTFGIFEFSAPTYSVNEASNNIATITVIRTSSALSNATVNFTTLNGTAFAGTNYIATNGILSFAPGQIAASFTVRILNDGVTNVFPFYFNVALTGVSSGALLGSPANAQVNILDAQEFNRPPGNGDVTFNQQGVSGEVLSVALQSDNKIVAGGNFTTINGLPRNHIARLNPDGTVDVNFLNGFSAADGAVASVAVQTDGHVLLGGSFQNVNGVVRHHIARVNNDGSLDTTFSPGSGADNLVFAVAETFNSGVRKIYVGGSFTTLGTGNSAGIERLNNDGTVDSTFASTGVNGTVLAVAAYPTNSIFAGKVLVAGSFTSVNGINQTNIARLNVDGSLDTNFNAGADSTVRAIAIQNDGGILLGGEFANVDGAAAVRLARLNSNGSLDSSFISSAAPGPNDSVDAITLQADNRILVGGQFTTANGIPRNSLTRLLTSGAADPTINFGDGANGIVTAIVVQPADQMILIGGGFTQYNDQPAPYLTRIYGGSATGSGAFEFTSASYQVNENGIQAVITIRRTGGTSGPNPDGSGNVSVQFATSPGSAVPTVNYTTVVTNVLFPPAYTVENVFVPVIDDTVITTNKTVNLALSNPSAQTGLGNQTNAVLTIVNTDNSVSFASSLFQVAKNNPIGAASITLVRNGGGTQPCTVGFGTTTNGTALIGTDYFPTNVLVTFNPGITQQVVQVSITNNNLPEGDRTVTMILSNAVGTTLVNPSNAVLTIKDTTFAPGQLFFASTNFIANESSGTATITVQRTNGTSGTVSAFYYTVPGTAQPGVSYISVSNTITFSDGQSTGTFTVPLVQNNLVLGTVNFGVVLATNSNSGTTLLSPTNATVSITDDNSGFLLGNATNMVLETTSPLGIQVLRVGPTNSAVSVNYSTHDGTAVAGSNYTTTAGILTFNPGETLKAILIPIIHDPVVTGTLQFTLALSNPSTGAALGYPSTNYIQILDADAGLSFTNSSMIVRRDIGNAVITVICTNPAVEPVVNSNTVPLSVQFATSDGSALNGLDYIKTNGTLVFTNGNGTNTFTVPILNGGTVTGDRTFNISLGNPTPPGQLVAPSNLSVTIVDATAGFKFSSKNYSVNKSAGLATINVYRTGLTNAVATIDFSATNGSAIPGTQYFPTNGTLVFTNGVTNQSFTVPVIDTTTVQPNVTVLLQLFNPNNGVLSSPNAATLTIKDDTGSFVVPAGSAIVSESGAGAPNGVIDSNETVTVLFGFRDAGGLNVNNLSATLIATNGVTPIPNPSTQVYGSLISGGHSVSEPFTFLARGTNGQQIAATFQLQDGASNIGTAVFGYTLGTTTAYYTNAAFIAINDDTTATPYPSTISVSNVIGTVLKATITLTNLVHTSPADIDAMLVSPEQQTVLFMAHVGGQNAINGVTLTFDDGASSRLLQSGQIFSGTNKPTAYLPVPVFP